MLEGPAEDAGSSSAFVKAEFRSAHLLKRGKLEQGLISKLPCSVLNRD